MARPRWLLVLPLVALAAAGSGCRGPTGDGDGDADADGGPDGDADADGGEDGDLDGGDAEADADDGDGDGPSCLREPGPADRVRQVVISHPYDASGDPASTYEVLELTVEGELGRTGRTFEMGRTVSGVIRFTPDGEVGLVAQEDGTLGVFRLDGSGEPEVIDPAYAGSFYATDVVVGDGGDRAWVLHAGWREHGGGIYEIQIGCDGRVSDLGLAAPSKLPYALVRAGDGRAVLAARDVAESPESGDDAHLLRTEGGLELLSGVDAFGDDEAIVAGAAATQDGSHVLLGDNAAFSGIPNRVAVVRIEGDSLEAVQVLPGPEDEIDIEDPVAIVTSPFDDAAIVVSGFGDAVLLLGYDPAETSRPFTLRGELEYTARRPALPYGAVLVARGSLEGLVLLAENVAVRRIRFDGGGSVADLGPTELGEGLGSIVGAIGVQP